MAMFKKKTAEEKRLEFIGNFITRYYSAYNESRSMEQLCKDAKLAWDTMNGLNDAQRSNN